MLDRFVATDRSLPLTLQPDTLQNMARQVLSEVLPPLDKLNCYTGRHGAGSTADKIPVGLRFVNKLEVTPQQHMLLGLASDFCLPYLPRREQVMLKDTPSVSRVTTVPKDGRGPRIICMEPFSMMYHQLYVMDALYDHMNSHPALRGKANVLDQMANRSFALEGSINGNYATIDLSEASDRVSLALVKNVFPAAWYPLLKACRSPQYNLNGTVKGFRKFAPMGSALCFPVETLIFWSLAVATVARESGISLERASRLVVVHGDDTIVPNKTAKAVMTTFESVGLVVNHDKSFHTGYFRESCGGDYYFGHDVAPVRWKHAANGSFKEDCFAFTKLRNTFMVKGWWFSARAIDDWLSINYSGCNHYWYKRRANDDITGQRYKAEGVVRRGFDTSTYREPAGMGLVSFLSGGGAVTFSDSSSYPVARTLGNVRSKDRVQPTDPAKLRAYWHNRSNIRTRESNYEAANTDAYKRGLKLRKLNVPIECDSNIAQIVALSYRARREAKLRKVRGGKHLTE
jgi:hypothetical protein